ncbi:MAG TPA: glycosyltransferase [Stellaceae bacterium]|nr:glycosyltransferase [Stellaceae bacterium]
MSLTPSALEADSRAYRIACTLAEAGFRSVVLEGRASRNRFWDDRLLVRSPGRAQSDSRSGAVLRPGRLRDAATSVRAGRLGRLGEAALYAGFRLHDRRRHVAAPRRLLPAARLYYLHSFEMYRAVAPLAARAGARIIYDAHDFYRGIVPPSEQCRFDRDRLRPFLDRLENTLVDAADGVVTVSGGVAEMMCQTFGRRPAVIRNCHDARADRVGGFDLRSALRLAPEDRLCVVVGNCKPGMAVATAIAALALLPERFHLAFLGRGYEAMADALPHDRLGNRAHLGYAVSPDEIVPAIRTADLGLVIYEPISANYRDALPNGFFQIVAAGLPLVRAPLAEIEAAIGDCPVGICLERLDAPTLAQAITRCAEDDGTFRANAAALARKLSWEFEAARLCRLVDHVLAANPASLPLQADSSLSWHRS